MLVKFYNNDELKYATRKRYNKFSFTPFAEEENKAVILGDGANTTVKTKKSNLCNYVTIDDTRWFVTSYIYMNGGQITLYLQRDVIGEMGVNNCFGKIERGYTSSILKNRKELSLNEILKDRKKIIPNTFEYGNYSVDNHNNELWGVMYFAKPTQLNPITNQPYPEQVNINIPAFSPKYVNYPVISDDTKYLTSISPDIYIQFNLSFSGVIYYENLIPKSYNITYAVTIRFNQDLNGNMPYTLKIDEGGFLLKTSYNFNVQPQYFNNITSADSFCYNLASIIIKTITDKVIIGTDIGLIKPSIPNVEVEKYDYTNVIVKENSTFYSYESSNINSLIYGSTSYNKFDEHMKSFYQLKLTVGNREFTINGYTLGDVSIKSTATLSYKVYKRIQLDNNSSGNIVIDTSQQLIDEPYSILVFPLYNVKISSGISTYNIKKQTAFMIFNTVIQYLSGENPYLIDAQVYPYCPVLTNVVSEINGYPFFSIASNSYNHTCEVQLLPNANVKKEYITRTYSIISPEQSGKFDFNFYDYITDIKSFNGNDIAEDDVINYAKMSVKIKTALKPFSIISSAIIVPSSNSLKGITYNSDLRGSQPTCNGFECSLSSNAFETYKRQNSNYQQTFNLQQSELKLQHETERVNEITSGVVNTVTATAMGAIGGSAMAGEGLFGIAGAITGGAAAGATVGTAQVIQYQQNEKLREFEVNLQKQSFDLQIGTIKNLPNSVNRISSFNEIILQDFWYIIETYECSDYEKEIVNRFINAYGYGLGVFDFISNFIKNGWFIRSTLISSIFPPNLHNVAANELMGGIYYYE